MKIQNIVKKLEKTGERVGKVYYQGGYGYIEVNDESVCHTYYKRNRYGQSYRVERTYNEFMRKYLSQVEPDKYAWGEC